jgi:hypothetical protein
MNIYLECMLVRALLMASNKRAFLQDISMLLIKMSEETVQITGKI